MGVVYNVNFKGRKEKFQMSGGCFGALNQGTYSHWGMNNDNAPGVRNLIREANQGEVTFASVRFIITSGQNIWQGHQRSFWTEMQEVINSVPWMKEVIILRKIKSVIDVICYDRPADQVALALMTVRNLSQNQGFIDTYCMSRDRGLSPVQAYVMSGAMYITRGLAGNSVARKGLGEYNHFDPNTFGRRSIARMLNPETPIPWQLDSWQELKGYRREDALHHLEGHRVPNGVRRGANLVGVLGMDMDEQLFSFDTFREGQPFNFDANQSKPMEVFDQACRELLELWPE